MSIKDYKELFVWNQSIKLAAGIYQFTGKLPNSEKFGIVSQMQRAAVSIPSNIAEGQGRSTRKEFVYFLYIARGSASELETQIILCSKLFPNINTDEILKDTTNIRGLLNILISKLVN